MKTLAIRFYNLRNFETRPYLYILIQSGQFSLEKVLGVGVTVYRMLRLHVRPGLSVKLHL